MAKTRALGADVQLLADFESVYGTPPGPGSYRRLSFRDTTLGSVRPLGYDPLLGQGRDAQDPYYEAITDDGDITVPIDVEGFGWWLKLLFGAATTTGVGDPYSHAYTSGGVLPSAAMDVGHVRLTTPRFELHQGVKAGSLAFDMARTGPANATIGLIAQGETNPASAADASPTAYALTRFNRGRGTIKLGGASIANVTGGRFNFSNGLEPVETIRDDGLIDGVDEGEAMAEGSITVRFGTDTTITDAVDAETPVALEYAFTRPGIPERSVTFALPRVFLPKVRGEIRGPGGIERTYDWRAAKDDTAGHLLQVTLVNNLPGTAY